jgi:hypothetical protein
MRKPKKLLTLVLVAFAGGLGLLPRAQACTTVALAQSSEKIVAKSYDRDRGHGFSVVNLRGIGKQAVRFGGTRACDPAKDKTLLYDMNQSDRGARGLPVAAALPLR